MQSPVASVTRESLADGKDASARVSFKQEALLSLSGSGTECSLSLLCLNSRDCCPYVTMGCSESVGSFDDTTCMRCGRTSLTSSPFIRFEWQDNVRTDLSAQQIRSCTASDGAYGCYCCRAGCASCCSGAIRVCTGLHESLQAAGMWNTSSSCTSIPTRAKIGAPSAEPTTVLLRRGRHLRPLVSDQISPDDEGMRFLLLSRR